MIEGRLKEYIRGNLSKGGLVCLTGAGISAESGIPVFRGKGGLWEKYDPEVFANSEGLARAFRENPEKIAGFLVDFYSLLLAARPNPGHLGLALLEKEHLLNAVITQNIDNLHAQAGSRNVIELHGNAFRIKCPSCGARVTFEKDRLKEMVELLKARRHSRAGLIRILSRYFPRCSCKGRFRIDIVLFGEALGEEELRRSYMELEKCKALLIIGTSLAVYPAAGLPLFAKERGACLIEVNNGASELSGLCDYKITGPAGEIVPEMINLIGNG